MANPKGEYTAKEMREAIRKSGGVVVQAANVLGCDPSTVYRYADKYVTVQETLDEVRLNLVAEAEGYHVRMMRDPDHQHHYKAVMDIRRNYDPEGFTDEKKEQEHSGPDEEPLKFQWVDPQDVDETDV